MQERGLVMEITGKEAIVLTPGGEFLRIHRPRSAAVGEEVTFRHHRFRVGLSTGPWALAACLILALLLPTVFLSGLMPLEAFAIVTVDINPSLELTVSEQGTVLEAVALNPAGEAILSRIQFRRVQLEECIRLIVEEAVTQNYPTELVLITTGSVHPEREGTEAASGLLREKAQAAAEAVVNQHQLESLVQTISVSNETRQQAREAGISAGKFAVMVAARAKGLAVEVDELKNGSITQVLKQAGVTPREIGNGSKENPGRPDKLPVAGPRTLPAEMNGKDGQGDEPGRPQDPPGQAGNNAGSGDQAGNDPKANGRPGNSEQQPTQSDQDKSGRK